MTAIPLDGDRAAKDVINYPSRHSTDLPSTPKHHVPEPGVEGNIPISDGTKWVLIDANTLGSEAPPIMTLGTREGELLVSESPFKIYNEYGANRSIIKVFLSVGAAPTGDDIIVDVAINGVSIFDLDANRPTILDGETTGYTVTIENPSWVMDDYLTWEILQVGSSVAGSDIVVHIVSTTALEGS